MQGHEPGVGERVKGRFQRPGRIAPLAPEAGQFCSFHDYAGIETDGMDRNSGGALTETRNIAQEYFGRHARHARHELNAKAQAGGGDSLTGRVRACAVVAPAGCGKRGVVETLNAQLHHGTAGIPQEGKARGVDSVRAGGAAEGGGKALTACRFKKIQACPQRRGGLGREGPPVKGQFCRWQTPIPALSQAGKCRLEGGGKGSRSLSGLDVLRAEDAAYGTSGVGQEDGDYRLSRCARRQGPGQTEKNIRHG